MVKPLARIRSFLTGQRGQSLVILALALPVLAGGLGLSIDIGSSLLTRTEAQKVADAAAVAGASFKLTGLSTGSCTTVVCEAQLYGTKNNYSGTDPGSTCAGQAKVCVYYPAISCPTGTYNADCLATPSNYIEVIITKTQNNYFMGVLGVPTSKITARAVANVNDLPKNYALLVLDRHACPAYSSSSNLTINNGGAMVDSDCPTGAVTESGGSIVTSVDTDGTGPNCNNNACSLDHYNQGTVVLSNNSTAVPGWNGVSSAVLDPLSCSPPANGWSPPPGNTGTCRSVPFACTDNAGTSTPMGCVPKSATSRGSPNSPQGTTKSECNNDADGTCHFRPGTYYGGLSITATSGTYTFESGIYVFAGGGTNGGFNYQSGNVSSTCAAAACSGGVTFFNTDDRQSGNANNRPCGQLSVTGSGTLTFNAPTSGPTGNSPYLDGYKNMLWWQSPTCATSDGTYTASNPDFKFAGGSSGSSWVQSGLMYMPKAGMQVTGGGNFGSVQIIVNSFNLGGGNNVVINYTNYANTGRRFVKLVE